MNEAPLNLYKIQMEVMTLSRVEIEVETTLSEEEVLFKLQDHPNTLLTPECGVSTHNGKINGAEVWCDMLNEGPTYITSCAVRAIHKETNLKEEPPQMETPDYKKIILTLAEELKIDPEILYYNEPNDQLILDGIVFPDEITGGTFTITNNGSAGSVLTMPIINQPQVAILSTDAIVKKPVVVNVPGGGESIAIHPVGNLAMAWDHRALDGAYAAGFLSRIKEILETRDWSSEV